MNSKQFEEWQEKSMEKQDRWSDQLLLLAEKILTLARNTLFVSYRYLENAVGRFDFIPANTPSITTDGEHIYYNPEWVIKRYKESDKLPMHDLLHMILHCIYRHAFVYPSVNRKLWDLASDMAVESVIADLSKSHPISINKRNTLDDIKKDLKLLTAERLMQYFEDLDDPDQIDKWIEEFSDADDHSAWYNPQKFRSGGKNQASLQAKGGPSQGSGSGEGDGEDESDEDESESERRSKMNEKWKDISEHVEKEIEDFHKNQGDGTGNMVQHIKDLNREKYDYGEFLKKFTVRQEVCKIDMDQFDYNFYAYGLEQYGDVALVEPLEYKEERKLREFVIAIDTSGSVQGNLVQAFLRKTYNIMFDSIIGRNLNIYIIQCDANIQEAVCIHSKEEFESYIKTMELKGFGGTDFRPVFEFVNKKVKDKEFTNLKGLIYFTDGYGTFPKKKQEYDTAFVFVNERNDPDFEPPEVPPWAIKLILEGRDI